MIMVFALRGPCGNRGGRGGQAAAMQSSRQSSVAEVVLYIGLSDTDSINR